MLGVLRVMGVISVDLDFSVGSFDEAALDCGLW